MKNFVILLVFILIHNFVSSQENSPYSEKKNELNIGFFNAFELSNIQDLGIGYKRVIKNGALRTGASFDISSSHNEFNLYDADNSHFSIDPRIGYEFHNNLNRFQLLYGLDLVGLYGYSKMEETSDNPIYNNSRILKSYGVSINPTIGFKFFINKRLSIGTETSIKISMEKGKTETVDNMGTRNDVSKQMNVGFGPLGIFSINIHF
jgi:hypothetical protein